VRTRKACLFASVIVHVTCRDMPPAGGFDAIRYKRNLPFRGPGGLAILGAVTGICVYGMYRVGLGNLEKR
jgi:NADH dehydrogenase (ubiquinone) 1 alpha subcomplex subunit 13